MLLTGKLLEGLVAVPVGGGRARAGLEIDHSEPSGSRVAISRAGCRPPAHTAARLGGLPPTGTHSGQAPQVWRAPEGPEGTGGLRDAAPSEARLPSLAGGRGLRRLENPWSQEQHAKSCWAAATGTHSGQVGRGGP